MAMRGKTWDENRRVEQDYHTPTVSHASKPPYLNRNFSVAFFGKALIQTRVVEIEDSITNRFICPRVF